MRKFAYVAAFLLSTCAAQPLSAQSMSDSKHETRAAIVGIGLLGFCAAICGLAYVRARCRMPANPRTTPFDVFASAPPPPMGRADGRDIHRAMGGSGNVDHTWHPTRVRSDSSY
ncbi:MAG: hypothetical protein ABIS14_12810 [Sphingomonas sp.]